MKKLLPVFVILALLLPNALAQCPQMAETDYPCVDGSTATLPLSYALMQAATGVDESTAMAAITHSKTTESFYALTYGDADLLLVYEPSEDAWQIAEEQGVELHAEPIGLDALVFLINEANPVDSLTQTQIVDIYSGKTTNWEEVGGDDLEIVAYQRVENSGSQVMMKAQVMKDVAMVPAPAALRTGEMGELIDAIAAYKNTADAIGYSVYYYVNNMYIQEGLKLLKVDGIAPSNETIASGEYPYCQPFYAVIRADEPADSPAHQLFDWLVTQEGADFIQAAGYVPATTK